MAAVLNISNLVKHFNDSGIQISDSKADRSVHLLITNTQDFFRTNNTEFSVQPVLQEDPEISCKLCFQKEGSYLQGNVSFPVKASNLHYEITLYIINYINEFEFLDTLNISDNVTSDSRYFFKHKFEIFSPTCVNILKHFYLVGGYYLFLYCKITKKEISQIKLQIPENESTPTFASLYKNKFCSDFKILCHNEEFCVHKAVLATRSSVFQAMLGHPMKEAQDNQIEINDFKQEIVKEMVHYIYTDEIRTDLTQEELQDLLIIADKYDLRKLKILCMQGISKFVKDVGKAFDVITFAQTSNIEGIKEAMIQFINENQCFLFK